MVRLKQAKAVNPLAYTASKAASGLIAAATGDLAVIRSRTRPRGRQAPIDYELHLNPAALGIAAVGAGLTMWLLQLKFSHKPVRVLMAKQIEADLPLESTQADIDALLPEGYSWYVVAPDQPFMLDIAGSAIFGLVFPAFKNVMLQPEDYVKYTYGYYHSTDRIVHHPEEGHWENIYIESSGKLAGSKWIIDKAAYDELIGYHLSGRCYKWSEKIKFGLDDRKGFSMAGPWP